jgi:hypothetical protein
MEGAGAALAFENIMTLAEREAGVHGLADEGLRARVKGMIDWINGLGSYAPGQIPPMQRQLQRLLVSRLRLRSDRDRYPAIAEERIEQPIFIIGFPRSGTSLLHELLAQDPETLAPQSWCSHTPSPPPGVGPVCAGRIALAHRAVAQWADLAPALLPLHPYLDAGAYQFIEDEELFTLDFRNAYPTLLHQIPKLDVNVMLGADPVGAFRFHREMLQHLQWNTGKSRWVCKGPSHQNNLAALFDVYPDALCVWAHRPLPEIYASNVAIRAATYDAIAGFAHDWSSQARARAEQMKASLDRLLNDSVINDPRIVHLPFRELSADPVGAVRAICERRGRPMGPAFEARVRQWLADPENRVDRYGRVTYSYEAFGLDRAWIEQLFADYSRRFGLADEHEAQP